MTYTARRLMAKQIRTVIKTMTYKPGWTMKLDRVDNDKFVLRLLIVTDDASGTVKLRPGDTMTLDQLTDVHYSSGTLTVEGIRNSIDGAIRIMLEHEHNEWLKFNGKEYQLPIHDKAMPSFHLPEVDTSTSTAQAKNAEQEYWDGIEADERE